MLTKSTRSVARSRAKMIEDAKEVLRAAEEKAEGAEA